MHEAFVDAVCYGAAELQRIPRVDESEGEGERVSGGLFRTGGL